MTQVGSSGTFSFDPNDGDGTYDLCTTAGDFLGNVAIGGTPPTDSSADQSSFRIGASVRF